MRKRFSDYMPRSGAPTVLNVRLMEATGMTFGQLQFARVHGIVTCDGRYRTVIDAKLLDRLRWMLRHNRLPADRRWVAEYMIAHRCLPPEEDMPLLQESMEDALLGYVFS